jgi:GNAT superfamily N-acetyltransferase
MQIIIRPFCEEDTNEMATLFQKTVRQINSRDYGPKQIEIWAPVQIDLKGWRTRFLGSFTFVATLLNQIVGFANLEATGHLDFFYVHADHQRKGIAKKLMVALVEQAARLHIGQLSAQVSITARPFFEQSGFKIDQEELHFNQSVEFIRFRMCKSLAQDKMHTCIEQSLHYLDSDEALIRLEDNLYWPKWDSPWWHMTLLNEMGLAKRIPQQAIEKMMNVLEASPIKIFPIRTEEVPEGLAGSLTTHCHCALGNIYQALAATGTDVDKRLPWIRQWFIKYQLPDGGLNCDHTNYTLADPASSMVATIAPLEAVLFHTPRVFTETEKAFLDLGAKCLIDRKLMLATSNPNNAEEHEDEEDWLKLCFPRFYFYDILRGLSFILHWADRRNQPLACSSISHVVNLLTAHYPDGVIKTARICFDSNQTLLKTRSGDWERNRPAQRFDLLNEVSRMEVASPFLSQKWHEAQMLMTSLQKRRLLEEC